MHMHAAGLDMLMHTTAPAACELANSTVRSCNECVISEVAMKCHFRFPVTNMQISILCKGFAVAVSLLPLKNICSYFTEEGFQIEVC